MESEPTKMALARPQSRNLEPLQKELAPSQMDLEPLELEPARVGDLEPPNTFKFGTPQMDVEPLKTLKFRTPQMDVEPPKFGRLEH